MEATSEAREDTRPEIPEPNLDNLTPWLNQVIDVPAEGYKTAKNPDDTPLTRDQQIELTKKQYRDMVSLHQQLRNHSEERMRSHALNDVSLKKELIFAARADKVSTKFK